MALTKWNELKGRDQEEMMTKYDFEKCEFLQRERGRSYDGVCNGIGNINKDENCLDCPYFIGNMGPKGDNEEMSDEEVMEKTDNIKMQSGLIVTGTPYIVDAVREGLGNRSPSEAMIGIKEDKNVESLEDEIFTKIYGPKDYDLAGGIYMMKNVIARLENIRKQNAKEALKTFLINYCDSEKCSTCTFECIDKCLIKMQISFLERGEE